MINTMLAIITFIISMSGSLLKPQNYYILNGIYGFSHPDESTVEKNIDNPIVYLSKKYENIYIGWSKIVDKSKDVSDVFGGNIDEMNEYGDVLQKAKSVANCNKKYIGCGPIALYGQLDYLSKYAGFSNLNPFNSVTRVSTNEFDSKDIYKEHSINLAAKVIKTVSTIEILDKGSLTIPEDYINSANKIFSDFGYSTIIERPLGMSTRALVDYRYSYVSCYGDSFPRETQDYDKTKKEIINSIDKGFPVTLWTLDGMGVYSYHFMNLYGYSIYRAYNKYGQYKDHLMFKIRMNWGKDETEYIDSDAFNCIGSYGLIFFENLRDNTFLMPHEYDLECKYSLEEIGSNLKNVNVYCLRTGYVKHFDDTNVINDYNFLTLSSKNKNAGCTYITYKSKKEIEKIFFDCSIWGEKEGFTKYCKLALQYKKDDEWVDGIDLLDNPSYNIFNPNIYEYNFKDLNVSEFRIYNQSYSIGNSNKGRLTLGTMSMFFK